jgi:hypothetical protein
VFFFFFNENFAYLLSLKKIIIKKKKKKEKKTNGNQIQGSAQLTPRIKNIKETGTQTADEPTPT